MERLIQEDYLDDPWKMLVCCILLNQTTNQQVRKVLLPLFELIPDPWTASNTQAEQIVPIIRSTGFSSVKSQRIVDLSKKWNSGFDSVLELPGVGRYASDSWKIFVEKNIHIQVTDKKLQAYLDSVLALPERVS